MKESFNPDKEEYKKVADLPEEKQRHFTDISEQDGGGFVAKDAVDIFDWAKISAEKTNLSNEKWERIRKEFHNDRSWSDTKLERLGKYAQILLDKKREKITPEDLLHERALEEDSFRNVIEEVGNGTVLGKIEELSSKKELITLTKLLSSFLRQFIMLNYKE